MPEKFIGAAARRLSNVQFLVLAEYAGGPRPIDVRDRFRSVRERFARLDLLIACASASRCGKTRRNGARFLRLSAAGRRLLEQTIMLRGGVPIIASPSTQPNERFTKHAEQDHPERVRRVVADAV